MDEDKINEVIDQAIDSLVDDSPEQSAGALAELAGLWAKAGLGKQSFYNIRQHVINSAKERTSAYFIDEKLQIAEQQLQEQRNERRIIIT